jgi:hypothetical protein
MNKMYDYEIYNKMDELLNKIDRIGAHLVGAAWSIVVLMVIALWARH